MNNKTITGSSLILMLSGGLFTSGIAAEDIKQLDDLTVTGNTAKEGYATHDEQPMIGRSQLSVDEMPRSVQVYNRNFIDDLQATTLDQITSYSSNLVYVGSNDGRDNEFSIRGFDFNALIVDGFKFRDSISNPEIYNMEQVEVLKGADSLLYGDNSPGGLISIVSKRPKHSEHGELTFETNSYGAISPRVDFGGRANEAGTVRYRMVGLYDNDPGWRDFNVDNERLFVAPSMSIDLTPQATLTMFAEYTDDNRQNDMGTAIDMNGQPVAPLEWVTTHPDDEFVSEQLIAGFDFDYVFNSNWSANIKGRYQDASYDYGDLWLPFSYSDPYYIRVVANQAVEYDEKAIQLNLNGDFNTGQIRHRLSVGIDISNAFSDVDGCFDPGSSSLLDFSTTPVYPDQPGDACDTRLYPGSFVYTGPGDDIKRRGIFFQDAINLTEDFLVNLGLRYEDHKQVGGGGSYSATSEESILLPQIGFMFQLHPQHAVYMNYSESFTPATTRDRNGQLLDAEEGKGYEIGLRSYLNNDALKLNIAYFDIEKTNVALTDPLFAFATIASGEQESHGIEVDLTGKLTSKLDLIASYGYLQTEDQGDNPGKELINAPNHTFALWGNYAVTSNWSVGAGVRHVASRFATYDNATELDSYTIVNAGVSYKKDRWKVRLNLNNLTDEEYIQSAKGGLARIVYPGEPFNATASVSYSFY